MLAKGVNGDDVGVVDPGHEARFPDEVLSNLRVHEVAPDHLDGHLAVEALVESEEDGAHRAPPNQLDEAVVRTDESARARLTCARALVHDGCRGTTRAAPCGIRGTQGGFLVRSG
jgi:hypothetical protein